MKIKNSDSAAVVWLLKASGLADVNALNMGAVVHTADQQFAARDQFMYHTLQVINPDSVAFKLYVTLHPDPTAALAEWVEYPDDSSIIQASGVYALPDGPIYYFKALRDNSTDAPLSLLLMSVSVTGNL